MERKKSIVFTSSSQRKKKLEVKKVVLMITVMGISFGSLVLPLDALNCAMLISRLLPSDYVIKAM